MIHFDKEHEAQNCSHTWEKKVSSLEYIPKDKVCYLEKAVGESVGAAEI